MHLRSFETVAFIYPNKSQNTFTRKQKSSRTYFENPSSLAVLQPLNSGHPDNSCFSIQRIHHFLHPHHSSFSPRPLASPKVAGVAQEGGRVQGRESVCWGVGVSWFLGLLLSGYLRSLVSRSFNFEVSWFLSFLFSWLLGSLVSWFQRFSVSKLLGFKVSWFRSFNDPIFPKYQFMHSVNYCSRIQDFQDFM